MSAPARISTAPGATDIENGMALLARLMARIKRETGAETAARLIPIYDRLERELETARGGADRLAAITEKFA